MDSTNQEYKGKAVVTGASSGLGLVYADRLAKRGFDLILVARRKDRLEALKATLIKKYGIKVELFAADLGLAYQLEDIAKTIANDDNVTMLINNAGTASMKPVSNTTLVDHDAMINVNVIALSRLSLAVLPKFKERNHGTIINIGSVLSFHTLPISGIYSATKAYVMSFTRGLQHDVHGTNVRVQLVMPAITATEIWDLSGIPLSALPQDSIMTSENCVDAALAGLDMGEDFTLPSVEHTALWIAYDEAREKLFLSSNHGKQASRYQAPVINTEAHV